MSTNFVEEAADEGRCHRGGIPVRRLSITAPRRAEPSGECRVIPELEFQPLVSIVTIRASSAKLHPVVTMLLIVVRLD